MCERLLVPGAPVRGVRETASRWSDGAASSLDRSLPPPSTRGPQPESQNGDHDPSVVVSDGLDQFIG